MLLNNAALGRRRPKRRRAAALLCECQALRIEKVFSFLLFFFDILIQ
jgi:hypothetical protein